MDKQKIVLSLLFVFVLTLMVWMYGINARQAHDAEHMSAQGDMHAGHEMDHAMNGTMSHHTMQHAEPKEAALVEEIKKGGYVLYVRHERTQLDKTVDAEPLNFDDCSTQRNLSLSGRESAKENGVALKMLGIPVSSSYASPFCRSYETAVELFGKTEKVVALSGRERSTDAFDIKRAGQLTKDFILAHQPAPGTNVALTGHWGTINAATGIHVHEGDMAVFRVTDGKLVHMGNIQAGTWSDVIHDNERAKIAEGMMMEHGTQMKH